MNTFEEIKKLLAIKSAIEERIALLQATHVYGVYVLNRGTDNWILLRCDECTSQYIGNLPNGQSLYWPEPSAFVLASAQCVSNYYSLDAWEMSYLEFVPPSDYPLYLSNVSTEFENMMKEL